MKRNVIDFLNSSDIPYNKRVIITPLFLVQPVPSSSKIILPNECLPTPVVKSNVLILSIPINENGEEIPFQELTVDQVCDSPNFNSLPQSVGTSSMSELINANTFWLAASILNNLAGWFTDACTPR